MQPASRRRDCTRSRTRQRGEYCIQRLFLREQAGIERRGELFRIEIDPHEGDLLPAVTEARMPPLEQPTTLRVAGRPRRDTTARPPPTAREDAMNRACTRVSHRVVTAVGEPDPPLPAHELDRRIREPSPEALRIERARSSTWEVSTWGGSKTPSCAHSAAGDSRKPANDRSGSTSRIRSKPRRTPAVGRPPRRWTGRTASRPSRPPLWSCPVKTRLASGRTAKQEALHTVPQSDSQTARSAERRRRLGAEWRQTEALE